MKEKSELNTLKVKRKIINCLEEKGYAAVDCDNQIDMVNREKVEEFCKAAEKEEQAAERFIRGYFIRFFGFELTSFCCGRNYIKNDYSTRRTYNVRAR